MFDIVRQTEEKSMNFHKMCPNRISTPGEAQIVNFMLQGLQYLI